MEDAAWQPPKMTFQVRGLEAKGENVSKDFPCQWARDYLRKKTAESPKLQERRHSSLGGVDPHLAHFPALPQSA